MTNGNGTLDGAAFDLTTDEPERVLFRVDGEEYFYHTFEHLTPEEATEFQVIARRSQVLRGKIDKEESEDKIRTLTREIRLLNTRLLALMTTMPADIIAKLDAAQERVVTEHLFKLVSQERCTNTECLALIPAGAKFCTECGTPTRVVDGEARELPSGEETAASVP